MKTIANLAILIQWVKRITPSEYGLNSIPYQNLNEFHQVNKEGEKATTCRERGHILKGMRDLDFGGKDMTTEGDLK